MSRSDIPAHPNPDTATPAGVVRSTPAFGQFATAWGFALREQTRNRLAGLLLVAFVPTWYLLMFAMVGHSELRFRLFATGQTLTVAARQLTLITAGLNSLSLIVGFTVFAAVRAALVFDRRLVFAGYRQGALIGAKALAIAAVALAVAFYTAVVLLVFWRPQPAAWLAVLGGFAVIACGYAAFGLFLGVLVRGDLEGFFLIIMVGLVDTFLQNPLGNPLANKPVLQWFPSFGPMQFAVGGSLGHAWLWGHLALGSMWAVAFTVAGLAVFRLRTRSRRHSGSTPPTVAQCTPRRTHDQ